MKESIIFIIIGAICIVLGIRNRQGNIGSLHAYHTRNISEEDRIPFGKKVGLGTMICGAAVITSGALSAITYLTTNPVFTTAGYTIMTVGLVIGLGIALLAIIKYNKGLFGFKK